VTQQQQQVRAQQQQVRAQGTQLQQEVHKQQQQQQKLPRRCAHCLVSQVALLVVLLLHKAAGREQQSRCRLMAAKAGKRAGALLLLLLLTSSGHMWAAADARGVGLATLPRLQLQHYATHRRGAVWVSLLLATGQQWGSCSVAAVGSDEHARHGSVQQLQAVLLGLDETTAIMHSPCLCLDVGVDHQRKGSQRMKINQP
jgi:hypothetical protein